MLLNVTLNLKNTQKRLNRFGNFRPLKKADAKMPRTYIYQYYNIDPIEGSTFVQKSYKIGKNVDNVICPIKKVDNDAICPIHENVEGVDLAKINYQFWPLLKLMAFLKL